MIAEAVLVLERVDHRGAHGRVIRGGVELTRATRDSIAMLRDALREKLERIEPGCEPVDCLEHDIRGTRLHGSISGAWPQPISFDYYATTAPELDGVYACRIGSTERLWELVDVFLEMKGGRWFRQNGDAYMGAVNGWIGPLPRTGLRM